MKPVNVGLLGIGTVGSGTFTNLVNGGQISGATANVLTIVNATTNSALDYRVIVSNSYGSVTSAPPTSSGRLAATAFITVPPASREATLPFSASNAGHGSVSGSFPSRARSNVAARSALARSSAARAPGTCACATLSCA